MKSLRTIAITTVTLSNVYYFTLWIIAFNKFNTQAERVTYFLEKWYIFNSIDILSTFLSILTLLSLVLLNVSYFNSHYNTVLRILCSIVNILFLLFLFWSYL